MIDETAREERLDQLLAEYLRRCDAGENVDRASFLEEYAEFADDLEQLLDTADLVDQMAGPVIGCDGEYPTQSFPGSGPTPVGQTDFNVESRGNRTFGEYELLEEIGRGGMGVVFKARQMKLDRIVAVKMILSGRLASEDDVRRFYAEARTAGNLHHPGIVGIHQVGEVDGQHYYSMDYVEGTTLRKLLGDGPLPPERIARYVKAIAQSMQYAHEHGVLHRDLKPSNVLIDADDRPHITDFGLAKHIDADAGLTASGSAVGTPSYMPPERASGKPFRCSPAGDVYAIGAILYELLVGKPAFRAETAVDTLLQVMHEEPKPPSTLNPDADDDLATICLKCLQKRPRRRYPSARDLAEELDRFQRDEPIRAKPIGKLAQSWYWMRRVPLVAALADRQLTRPTLWHRRVQRLLLAIPLLIAMALVVWKVWPETLPSQIRIASGMGGGMYYRVAEHLGTELHDDVGRPVTVLRTSGSLENRRLLIDGKAEVGLLQSGSTPMDELAVVAPLYYEVVYVVARGGQGIDEVADLRGKAVSLGPNDSGMRRSALRIIEHYEIDLQSLTESTAPFTSLLTDKTMQAAIVTTGLQNDDLKALLRDERFTLLPIHDRDAEALSRKNHCFKPTHIYATDVPRHLAVGEEGIPSVMTPAFLAVRIDATGPLVRTLLETLYLRSDMVARYRLMSIEQAAEWQDRALHPAARKFFLTAIQ